MIIRPIIALIVAVAMFLLLLRLSSFGAQLSFLFVDGIFPAISGETTNTSTRHGLSITAYNLAFLVYAACAAGLGAVGILNVRQTASRPWVLGVLLLVCLCMTSSAMFWPGEQLINIKAFSLLAAVQLALAGILLWLTWVPLQRIASFRVMTSLLLAVLSYWGLVLPVLHLGAALFYKSSLGGWLNYLDTIGHVIGPLVAVAVGYLHYRPRLPVTSEA